MEEISVEFNQITDDKSLHQFVKKYDLEKKEHSENNVLYVYSGTIDCHPVKITHYWKDRSRTFEIRPNRNDIKLEIKNESGELLIAEKVSYLDAR